MDPDFDLNDPFADMMDAAVTKRVVHEGEDVTYQLLSQPGIKFTGVVQGAPFVSQKAGPTVCVMVTVRVDHVDGPGIEECPKGSGVFKGPVKARIPLTKAFYEKTNSKSGPAPSGGDFDAAQTNGSAASSGGGGGGGGAPNSGGKSFGQPAKKHLEVAGRFVVYAGDIILIKLFMEKTAKLAMANRDKVLFSNVSVEASERYQMLSVEARNFIAVGKEPELDINKQPLFSPSRELEHIMHASSRNTRKSNAAANADIISVGCEQMFAAKGYPTNPRICAADLSKPSGPSSPSLFGGSSGGSGGSDEPNPDTQIARVSDVIALPSVQEIQGKPVDRVAQYVLATSGDVSALESLLFDDHKTAMQIDREEKKTPEQFMPRYLGASALRLACVLPNVSSVIKAAVKAKGADNLCFENLASPLWDPNHVHKIPTAGVIMPLWANRADALKDPQTGEPLLVYLQSISVHVDHSSYIERTVNPLTKLQSRKFSSILVYRLHEKGTGASGGGTTATSEVYLSLNEDVIARLTAIREDDPSDDTNNLKDEYVDVLKRILFAYVRFGVPMLLKTSTDVVGTDRREQLSYYVDQTIMPDAEHSVATAIRHAGLRITAGAAIRHYLTGSILRKSEALIQAWIKSAGGEDAIIRAVSASDEGALAFWDKHAKKLATFHKYVQLKDSDKNPYLKSDLVVNVLGSDTNAHFGDPDDYVYVVVASDLVTDKELHEELAALPLKDALRAADDVFVRRTVSAASVPAFKAALARMEADKTKGKGTQTAIRIFALNAVAGANTKCRLHNKEEYQTKLKELSPKTVPQPLASSASAPSPAPSSAPTKRTINQANGDQPTESEAKRKAIDESTKGTQHISHDDLSTFLD